MNEYVYSLDYHLISDLNTRKITRTVHALVCKTDY